MNGQVTILLPVREYRLDYLSEAIASVQGQSSGAWRMLVIVELSARKRFLADSGHLLTDERIELIVNQGRGLAGKLNTGMRHATTPFVAVIFADDLWEANAVEVLDRHIAMHPDADLFHSSRRFVDDCGRPISGIYRSREHVRIEDFVEGAPVKHLLCWRVRRGLEVGGIDESLHSIAADDLDFPWTLAEHGARFVAVPDCLYIARDHRQHPRLTTHVPRSVHVRVLRRILRKHGVTRQEIRRRVGVARQSYLQQCIYANRPERWIKQRLRRGSGESWREPFLPL